MYGCIVTAQDGGTLTHNYNVCMRIVMGYLPVSAYMYIISEFVTFITQYRLNQAAK